MRTDCYMSAQNASLDLCSSSFSSSRAADGSVTYHSVTSLTGFSVTGVLCWRAGVPTPTLAIGSVAALLKLTRVQSLLQHPGQGLPKTAGLGQHPGQGLPRKTGLVQHPGQGLPRTAGPTADCQGEMSSLCGVGSGCFYCCSCCLTFMHRVTSCTVSHHAQYHIMHSVTSCAVSHHAQCHIMHNVTSCTVVHHACLLYRAVTVHVMTCATLSLRHIFPCTAQVAPLCGSF